MPSKDYDYKSQRHCRLIKKEDDNKPIINHRRQRSVMIISSLFIAILLGIFILAPKIKNDLSKKYILKEHKINQTKQDSLHLSQ